MEHYVAIEKTDELYRYRDGTMAKIHGSGKEEGLPNNLQVMLTLCKKGGKGNEVSIYTCFCMHTVSLDSIQNNPVEVNYEKGNRWLQGNS